MHKYCKAYKLGDLRNFQGWSTSAQQGDQNLSDDTVCYVYDDFTVVQSPFHDEKPIFDAVTSEWQEFCRTVLKFEIPEDLRYAYEQPAN